MMSTPLKTNIGYLDAALILIVTSALTVFCWIAHLSLIIPLLLLFLGVHLFFFQKSSMKLFLNFGLLLAIVMFTTVAFERYTTLSPLLIPVASIAMLTVLLFNDLQLAFVMSFLSSVLVSLMIAEDQWLIPLGLRRMDVMLIFLLGGLTAAYTLRDARTRGKLIGCGVYAGLIQLVAMVLLQYPVALTGSRAFFMQCLYPLLLNGLLSALAVIATLKIFEYLFGVLTNFSLLELSDFNQPLLKRMVLEAPGTYHHSLVVSNIAEAAADTIGANALLTRVGAYYHDIGKMEKSEYFTENQIATGNKHDDIEPSMSRLVVLNHVKEGLEIARKYHLNPIIASFIPEHHGTSLMHYFYQKALEEAEDPSEVKEENYRYPGPKPQSKETAIVLLADSSEAATRSLDDPTPTKIEDIVRKVINNKFIDGQLDECNLTLKDIDLIARTFARILSAMHHSRVKYPELKNAPDYRNPKSAEENFPQPAADQENGAPDS